MFLAVTIAGCVDAPTETESKNNIDHRDITVYPSDAKSAQNAGYLNGARPDDIVQCRDVAPTGSRLRRTICGPQKDDSELFSIIDAGGSSDVHQ